ncbi:HNH endonuclease [Denitromonas iodatirespirans]|uniref:HNH endonuclease n=1 Tax=Denitromonas iodatirespirans TaxID=2795389 RepID=A0A944DAJ9_DENI1|nr:HNH endonuclease [Denitromonas iodatirespirans]MBT0962999.1 HNH endonuclease [Denitromonas iodatirespirans]
MASAAKLSLGKYLDNTMLESHYILGANIPPFDAAITAALSDCDIDGGGNAMHIAVENFDNTIYRVISSVGMGAYIHVTGALEDLGMKDLLADELHGRNGYDSWFVVTDEMDEIGAPPNVLIDDPVGDVLAELQALEAVPETMRQAIVQSRVGQGEFRARLLVYWKACAVTGAVCAPVLKASHIKPWRVSSNAERLDVFNGLLLSPNLDAVFDTGLITFDALGKIMLSKAIVGTSAYQLHINARMRVNRKLLRPEHEAFLDYHRRNVFRG